MSQNTYEKIELPIDAVDAQPHRPDFKWAGIMIGVIVGFFAFSFLAFHLFANLIVANISLEQEKKLFGDFFQEEIGTKKLDDYYTFSKQIPEFKKYNIYVNDEGEANAFAFLGGNIVITQKLIDSAKYEEEIIFVLAHEVAHVESRHVLKAIARNLPFKITLFFIGLDINLGITNITDTAINASSRETEKNADDIAIKTLLKHGLNPYCASGFFEDMADFPLEFMSTHPANESRIENIKKAGSGKQDFSDCAKIESNDKT